MWVAVVLHMWTAVVLRMLSALFDISDLCVVVLIIPMLICVIVYFFLNFSQPGDENVEVHVDVNQGDCVVAGGGSVDASVSVVVDSAEPSVPQESHDVVSPSWHKDSDFGIEKPLENVVPTGRVTASPICLAPNDVPDVFRVEPHVAEVSMDVVVDWTVVNP